jgi:hypothetical protein
VQDIFVGATVCVVKLPHLKSAFATSSPSPFGKRMQIAPACLSQSFLPLLPLQQTVFIPEREALFK